MTRDEFLAAAKALREQAEAAGIVEDDPWDALDTVWTGPDVDPSNIGIVTAETMRAVFKGYVEGRVELDIVNNALKLFEGIAPRAFAAIL